MNDSGYAFFYLLLNILGTYIIFQYFDLFFRKKRLIEKRHIYFIAVIYYGCISYMHLYINTPAMTMIGNLCLFYMISSIYEGDIKKRLLSVLLIYLILLTAESASVLCMSFLSTKNQLILGFALSKVITLILLGLFNRYCSLKEELLIPKLQIVAIFVFPIGAIILFYILIEYAPKTMTLISLIILLIFIILIYYILNQINKDYRIMLENKIEYNKKKLEAQMYEQEKLSYLKQLDILNHQRKEIQNFRHDLKNHMIGMNHLIENNDINGLKNYIKRIDQMELNNILDTGNPSLDSIINYKLSSAKEKGIQYELDISIPVNIGIEPFDINVIFGNLIENAIEASERCDDNDKLIKIKMKYDIGMLYAVIENHYKGEMIYNDQEEKFISSKKDKENHGIGLESVKRSLERYNGCIEFETKDQTFKVHIFLYMK